VAPFSDEIENGGYGALLLNIGQINGETGIFLGGQGGWIINHRLVLGVKGYGLVNRIAVKDLQYAKLEFISWGGLIEYTLASNNLLQLNVNSMIGSGALRFATAGHQNEPGYIKYSRDVFLIVEPGINLDLKVSDAVRIGLGVAYRSASRVEYKHLGNSDLSGLSGQVMIKLGVF